MRTLADDIFCDLPAPKPSRQRPEQQQQQYRGGGGGGGGVRHSAPAPRATINMRAYNNASGGCFLGSCTVAMATGTSSSSSAPDKLVQVCAVA